VTVEVVIPTTGRPSLRDLLLTLTDLEGPRLDRVLVVDDRRRPAAPLRLGAPRAETTVQVLRGPGRGPAAARNAGWRAARADWVCFLDDDVVPTRGWLRSLSDDLAELDRGVAGSQGRVRVPLPDDRRPTDWERNVAGLARAQWATADMAYRRSALAAVGGFDERFERAYREDADLALRMRRRGYPLVTGRREVVHPVRPADPLVSVRLQAGNADDVLMRALHGRRWRAEAGAPRGRLRRHLAVTGAGAAGLGALALGRRRTASAAGGAFLAGTAELAWARTVPGPRTRAEVATMLVSSALLPPAGTAHWLRGLARLPLLLRDRARAPRPEAAPAAAGTLGPPAAVLLDRDGTLIEDVPYNGDPDRVRPLPGARRALERLRAAGVALAVVSNQSGIGRGLLREETVRAVNRRVEELLGPLGPFLVCPHAPEAGCHCRKPAPGLVLRAAALLGVPAERSAVIGDIGADVEAAQAAGARAVLVPTARTRSEEVDAAPAVAADLEHAVDLLLGSEQEALAA
jgi:histidinol-phosphate phosphatase family protein